MSDQERESRTRKTRETETRQSQEFKFDFDNDRRFNLKYIKPRPGMVQRWVRTEVRGEDDPDNVQRQHDRYWTPRHSSTVPAGVLTDGQDRNGVVKVRGMVLMERPIEADKAHRKAIDRRTEGQKAQVKRDLMESSHLLDGMKPYVDSSTRVETGNMRVADDDD